MSNSWLDKKIAAASQSKIGLIDIGSNSIRLVVYDRLKRAPYSIYNEKVMCQLGKGLSLTGKLNPEGVTLAHAAIARYVALAKNMEVTELDVIATAAVRDASDGADFAHELEHKHNLFIEIISGKREAKLGAYGILSSMYQPHGLVGDLGGGSLELVSLDENQRIRDRISLPIGALRLIDECENAQQIRHKVRQAIEKEPWLGQQKGRTFYAIGGSFRNLARMYRMTANYPLTLTHGYTVNAPSIKPLLRRVSEAAPDELAQLPGVSKKRLQILPASAIVLDELIEVMAPAEITFSSSGIREGYLFEKLSPFIRVEDGLIASSIEVAGNMHPSLSYASELFDWMQTVIKKQSDSSVRIVYSVCLLQDIARYIHPDHRAEWAYMRIIQSNLYGLNHKQRVQLALTLYYRYQYKMKHRYEELELLDEKSKCWAELMGGIASLAHHLTGGVAGSLPSTRLFIGKQGCELTLPDDMSALRGEIIDKRLRGIFEAYQSWRQFK